VKNARLAVESSRIDLEIQKQNLYKDVQTAYNEEYSALQKVKAGKSYAGIYKRIIHIY
jgi:outer membrane protein TolC